MLPNVAVLGPTNTATLLCTVVFAPTHGKKFRQPDPCSGPQSYFLRKALGGMSSQAIGNDSKDARGLCKASGTQHSEVREVDLEAGGGSQAQMLSIGFGASSQPRSYMRLLQNFHRVLMQNCLLSLLLDLQLLALDKGCPGTLLQGIEVLRRSLPNQKRSLLPLQLSTEERKLRLLRGFLRFALHRLQGRLIGASPVTT